MNKSDFSQLMRMGWGFRESKIFLVANDWDLFSHLSESACSLDALAAHFNANTRALGIMLNAMVSMKLLVKENDRYRNGELAENFLVKGRDSYRGEIFKHLHHCWEQWSSLEEIIKSGVPQTKAPLSKDRTVNHAYIWGMDNVGRERAEKIVAKLDVSGFKKMLDLGCGAATYSIAFAKTNPRLEVVCLDLPLTLEVSKENIAKNNLNNQFKTIEGSFWEVEFGSGYDLIWLSQIIHGHSEEKCLRLIKKSVASLAPGGRLIIHDFLLNDDCASPYQAALFSTHMLVITEGGQSYSANEARDWFAQAGLKQIQALEIDAQSSLMVGIKP